MPAVAVLTMPVIAAASQPAATKPSLPTNAADFANVGSRQLNEANSCFMLLLLVLLSSTRRIGAADNTARASQTELQTADRLTAALLRAADCFVKGTHSMYHRSA
jgi:hypothetical protein